MLFNCRLLMAHTQRTEKKKIQNLANHIPAGLWKLYLLRKGVFLMASELFWLRNPGMLCLILKFKQGTVGHLDELAICTQVGRTVWKKVRVYSLCLKGFTQFVSEPQPNHQFRKSLALDGALLQSMYLEMFHNKGSLKQGC